MAKTGPVRLFLIAVEFCQHTGLFSLDVLPYRIGVPKSRTSGFESFEAPDPAEWTQHGYAIVNIDARGAFMSEGDTRYEFQKRF